MSRILPIFMLFAISFNVHAGRPFSTEDANTVGDKKFQLEGGFEYTHSHQYGNEVYRELVALQFGPVEPLEFGVEIPFAVFDNKQSGRTYYGLEDVTASLKAKMIYETKYCPSILIKMFISTKTGDYSKGLGDGGNDIGMLAVATKSIGRFTIHGNIGYVLIGNDTAPALHNYMIYGLAAEYNIIDTLNLVGEVYGEGITRYDLGPVEDDMINPLLGLTYAPWKNITFDASFKASFLTRGTLNILGPIVGITAPF